MRSHLLFPAIFLVACAPVAPAPSIPASAPPEATPVTSTIPPREIHWTRSSAERRALLLQIYRSAGEQLRQLAAGREPGTWAVILDADETVLDNSPYQIRIWERGESFSPETWNAWVREAGAEVLPGAAEFIELARELGGRVAIITNRDEVVCPETRTNLESLGIRVDVVLCRREGQSDKNPRYRAVQQGTAAPDLPPLDVLMWIGDNIQDFPDLSQEIRFAPPADLEAFGRRFFLIPNPMYGSWERNPPR